MVLMIHHLQADQRSLVDSGQIVLFRVAVILLSCKDRVQVWAGSGHICTAALLTSQSGAEGRPDWDTFFNVWSDVLTWRSLY